jgi:GNAT superfamily N-acetyltransferase
MGDEAWRALGVDARERYEAYINATKTFRVEVPHHYLNMIGVRHTHAGHGYARPLLEAVRRMSVDDPNSRGVLLTTERAKNVKLYEHFGYVLVGHVEIAPTLESWGMFLDTTA